MVLDFAEIGSKEILLTETEIQTIIDALENQPYNIWKLTQSHRIVDKLGSKLEKRR